MGISKMFVVSWALFGAVASMYAQATWSKEKKEQTTEYLKQYRKEWTAADTERLFAGDGENAVNIGGGVSGGGTTMESIIADDGSKVSIVASGESLLVNGKDVTGNLGSKTTYGSNSPIIENVKDSQVAAGSQNSAARDTTTNYSLTVSLSIALSISAVLNLHLLRTLRRRGKSGRSGRTRSAGASHTPHSP